MMALHGLSFMISVPFVVGVASFPGGRVRLEQVYQFGQVPAETDAKAREFPSVSGLTYHSSNRILFRAFLGREENDFAYDLWQTDGTVSGTTRLLKLDNPRYTGTQGSSNLVPVNDTHFFFVNAFGGFLLSPCFGTNVRRWHGGVGIL